MPSNAIGTGGNVVSFGNRKEKRLKKDAADFIDSLLLKPGDFVPSSAFKCEVVCITQKCKCGSRYISDGGILLGYNVGGKNGLTWKKANKVPVGRTVDGARTIYQQLETCFKCAGKVAKYGEKAR